MRLRKGNVYFISLHLEETAAHYIPASFSLDIVCVCRFAFYFQDSQSTYDDPRGG